MPRCAVLNENAQSASNGQSYFHARIHFHPERWQQTRASIARYAHLLLNKLRVVVHVKNTKSISVGRFCFLHHFLSFSHLLRFRLDGVCAFVLGFSAGDDVDDVVAAAGLVWWFLFRVCCAFVLADCQTERKYLV